MLTAKNSNMLKSIAALGAAVGLMIAASANAHSAPRGGHHFGGQYAKIAEINSRIANQRRRIRRNVRRGRLTWVEARRVRFELSHIRGFRAQYLVDDHLSRREVRHMHRLLNRNSRRIRRLAHNGRNGWRNWRRHADFDGPRIRRLDGFR